MSEEAVNKDIEDSSENLPEENKPQSSRRRYFTRRNFFISLTLIAAAILILVLAGWFSFRYGYVDSYIKNQFIKKMDDIGITFTTDVFRTTVSPMSLEMKNAVFVDKITGEKLFRIDNARLGITATDLYAWQLSRDFRVDSTEIDGAEVWVKFDENGRSNFSNLKFVEEERGYVNFNYTSMDFSLKNGLIRFGDQQRKIAGDAKNVKLDWAVENAEVPDEQKRYKFDLTSTQSNIIYDEKQIEPVDIYAKGLIYREGAEITELKLNSPFADSVLNGKIEGWKDFRYTFNIESTVDLTQTGTIFASGTALRGFGNFKGTVSGEGDKYAIDGEIDSESLAADNVRLKALQTTAKINVEDGIYEANGKAIADMLTVGDFQINFPQLIGNVRGTGSDFKWFGELQAAAAKTPQGTIGSLYISDAVAEYKDKKLNATLGNVSARNFFSEEAELEFLKARNVRVNYADGAADVNAPNVTANTLKVEGAELRGLNAANIKVRNRGNKTDIQASNLQAQNLETKDANLRSLNASGVNVTAQSGGTTVAKVNQLRADEVNASGAKIGNLNASNVDVTQAGNETRINSGNLQVGSVKTDGAVIGSLNIAGVRLTIREGRVEGTSGDINAGNIDLQKQGKLENVRLARPVFVLEPSGNYRASADMSLGGGVLGSVRLGAARANVVATGDDVTLNNLTADVMDGKIDGKAVIALNKNNRSRVNADFRNLDLSKIIALQGGRVMPIAGETTGKVDLSFQGTNFKAASGTVTADFVANAGTQERGLVPVNGRLELNATNGLFDIRRADLNTEKSLVNASGRFDLDGNNSNLNLALNSSDATEIRRILTVLNVSPELEKQLADNQIQFAGNLRFDGTLTGNLKNPTVSGRASLESVTMRGRELGSLASNILVASDIIELREGILQERGSGSAKFNIIIPQTGKNNISVQASLNRINTGNLAAALPLENVLPENLRDIQAETSGALNLVGLPNEMRGSADLSSGKGTISGQSFEGFEAKLKFDGTLTTLEKFETQFADGFLRAGGTYDNTSTVFNLDIEGKNLQAARLRPFIPNNETFPDFGGTIDLIAKATGRTNETGSYNVNFQGTGRSVTIRGNPLGEINFVGNTVNQQLNTTLTANFEGQIQVINGSINFADENLPMRVVTDFNNTELAPFIALFRPPDDQVAINGRATGKVLFEGNLSGVGADGKRTISSDNLNGTANFTEFSLNINNTPFMATEPISIRFDSRAVVVENAKFAGAGSNVVVSGTKALSADGINNLSINGKINMRVLDAISKNTFFTGLTDVSIRLTGVNRDARLSGTGNIINASISTFVASERLNFDRINGRVLFTSNQVQIEQATGFLGGGKVVASGGALLDNLKLDRFRLELRGNNVTAPLPEGFVTTADADVTITGRRAGNDFDTLIAGNVLARRAIYSKDIDLADVISNRTEGSISEGAPSLIFGIPRLDLTLQGRDSLFVRNNLADLTASADLRITGDVDNAIVTGRITANEGTLFYRNDRYNVRRGVLEFPPQSNREPFINLQAETEIKGYQITVDLLGELTDTESLSATVRSNPSLPQADVVSLITTGNLANSGTGIPTLAQTGINTAAEILTDTLVNDPLRKATDKLFGLNRFEIDPILSGSRLDPTARLTVGRQINRNLLVTYSTNLSEDQQQVLALEYRVSNRLSFIAKYEQRSLSNITRNRDNFSFEIRLRKKF